MDRNWLLQYPAGVPADIDPDRVGSLKALIEEAMVTYRRQPAFTNMGATLTYAQLDELSRGRIIGERDVQPFDCPPQ